MLFAKHENQTQMNAPKIESTSNSAMAGMFRLPNQQIHISSIMRLKWFYLQLDWPYAAVRCLRLELLGANEKMNSFETVAFPLHFLKWSIAIKLA